MDDNALPDPQEQEFPLQVTPPLCFELRLIPQEEPDPTLLSVLVSLCQSAIQKTFGQTTHSMRHFRAPDRREIEPKLARLLPRTIAQIDQKATENQTLVDTQQDNVRKHGPDANAVEVTEAMNELEGLFEWFVDQGIRAEVRPLHSEVA